MQVLLQYFLPRLGITYLFGWLAEIRTPWIKNYLIKRFIRKYKINLAIADRDSITEYENFNDFFSRKLKKQARQIDATANSLVSPADGYLYCYGSVATNPLFLAKGFEFSLKDLLV